MNASALAEALVEVHKSGADVIILFDRLDEDASVADFPSSRGGDHGLDHIVHLVILDNNFDLDLRQKRNLVLDASVHYRMAFLTAMAAHFRDGHSFYESGESGDDG